MFYGENEAEYGNPIADTDAPLRDTAYFAIEHSDELMIGGVPLSELREKYGLTDIDLYLPADPDHLDHWGIEVHYLGYYLKWKPQESYYYAVEHGGFEPSPERTPGTYSKYNSIDDQIDSLEDDVVSLPAGTYLLTRVGDDDASASGDLDVTGNLVLGGAGADVTVIDPDAGVAHPRGNRLESL